MSIAASNVSLALPLQMGDDVAIAVAGADAGAEAGVETDVAIVPVVVSVRRAKRNTVLRLRCVEGGNGRVAIAATVV